MNFQECVVYFAGESELVVQFERLYGHQLTRRKPRNGLEAMVDKATGYDQWAPDEEAMSAFTEFVWDCVWTRLPEVAFEDGPTP